MNRNIILIVILVLVSGIAFYIWKTKKDPSTNFERTESNFQIEDVNSIARIIITNKEGVRSDLKREGDHWTINDEHRVRQTNIDHLLKGIQRQKLEHIPTRAASEGVISSMAVNGIHVEIFDNAGNKMLGYYVGGVTPDELGTFFLKEGSNQPYSLADPGWDGSMRVRYALRPVDWRDVRFWIEDNEKIDTLKVNYPKEHQHSFIISKNGSNYDVRPLFSTTVRKENVNTTKVESYFTSLSKLACVNYLSDSPEKDSILQSVPFMEMEMIYPEKKSYLRFFSKPSPRAEGSTAIPSYFIDYSGKDFMIAQHEVVKGAFRSYESFFD
ncbi:MAG TPA: hypothetical protein VMZ69_00320 [Saprospiraceae bacterium]|nr:hypothetical protein [Saprospiraceae bacterium]